MSHVPFVPTYATSVIFFARLFSMVFQLFMWFWFSSLTDWIVFWLRGLLEEPIFLKIEWAIVAVALVVVL